MAKAVVDAIEQVTRPLFERIKTLEAQVWDLKSRPLIPGPPGEPGKDGIDGTNGKDADESIIQSMRDEITELCNELSTSVKSQVDVGAMVVHCVAEAVKEIPIPKDGKDGVSVAVTDLAPLVSDEVEKAIAAIPPARDGEPGQDGRSVTVDDVAPMIVSEVQKALEAIPRPKDGEPGKSVDLKEVDALIATHVATAVASMPAPQDGKSVTVEDVSTLIESEVQKVVSAMPVPKDGRDGRDGKDGVGLTGALINKEGALVLTLADGQVKEIGRVVGIDGRDGKDGRNGVDGISLGLDHLSPDGEFDVQTRTAILRFSDGVHSKDVRLPMPGVQRYQGVYSDNRAYDSGDVVTYGGSMWIAKQHTIHKPEEHGSGSHDWTLCVKRGRDGKQGEKGQDGKDGRPGRDLTQPDGSGRKW